MTSNMPIAPQSRKRLFASLCPLVMAGAVTVAMPVASPAANIGFAGVLPGGSGLYHKPVVSLKEAKYNGLIRQHTDFSCGAAALATILKYAYGQPVSEADVLKGLFTVSDESMVRQRGFSLLDIKRYVGSLGYRGRGYRIPLPALEHVRIPTLILLDINGYKHFVVLRRVLNDKYYVADPALGNRIMKKDQFEKSWNGIIFAVIGKGFDRNTSLRNPVAPPTVKRFSISAPLSDAELYEYGFSQKDLF